MVLFDIKMSIFGAELACVIGGYEVRSRGHVTISRFVPSGTLAFNEVPMDWHGRTLAFEEISLGIGPGLAWRLAFEENTGI